MRILFVDDDQAILKTMNRILSGFLSGNDASTVVVLLDPTRESLEHVLTQQAGFDVVVSDKVMTHLKGSEVLHACRRHAENVGCVLYSGTLNTFDINGCPRGTVLLAKPFGVSDLITAIKRAAALSRPVGSRG